MFVLRKLQDAQRVQVNAAEVAQREAAQRAAEEREGAERRRSRRAWMDAYPDEARRIAAGVDRGFGITNETPPTPTMRRVRAEAVLAAVGKYLEGDASVLLAETEPAAAGAGAGG